MSDPTNSSNREEYVKEMSTIREHCRAIIIAMTEHANTVNFDDIDRVNRRHKIYRQALDSHRLATLELKRLGVEV